MKKILFLFVSLFVMNVVAFADNDKPVQVSQMPKKAQTFIQKHFATQSVAMAKVDAEFMGKNYDVTFTSGIQVEFDKKGNWTKVDCDRSQVPAEIVPAAVQQYVSKNYPDAQVVKIEKTDRKGYEVELSNGFDIEFDKKMNVIDIER